MEQEGMLQVIAGQRTNTMRSEELVFIQQIGEYPVQLLFVEKRKQPPSLKAYETLFCRRKLRDYLGMTRLQKCDHFHEFRVPRHKIGLKYGGGAKRQQSDQRSHF